ncbi:hypothetical protein OC845_005389 [Tilletia horrida]|nr:hypothetical protein OC845_005389 [Tilletia horrida]
MVSFKEGLDEHNLPYPDFTSEFHLLPLLRPLAGAPNASAPEAVAFQELETNRPARIAFQADGADWISTTHALPAAYPRTHDHATSPPSRPLYPPGYGTDDPSLTAKQVRQNHLKLMDETMLANLPPTYYPPKSALDAELDAERRRASRQPQLWSVVERIVPIHSGKARAQNDRSGDKPGLTLVFAHANGFHKETYEPFAEALIKRLPADPNGERVDEIWSIDVVDSGDAGGLNAASIGNCVHWMDHPRDILNFLRHYLPAASKTGGSPASTGGRKQGLSAGAAGSYPADLNPNWPARLLPRTEPGAGLKGRRIVMFGHSFSGSAVALLNVMEPTLTERTILVDPVILDVANWEDGIVGCWPSHHPLATGAAVRKDLWPTRAAAAAFFKTKPYFTAWVPKALDLFVRFGLRTVKRGGGLDSPHTLSMSKWSEAEAFKNNWQARYTWGALERNRGRGTAPLHLLAMSKSADFGIYGETNTADRIRALVKSQSESSTEKVLEGGHLIVQQNPDQLAEEVQKILVPVQTHAETRARL